MARAEDALHDSRSEREDAVRSGPSIRGLVHSPLESPAPWGFALSLTAAVPFIIGAGFFKALQKLLTRAFQPNNPVGESNGLITRENRTQNAVKCNPKNQQGRNDRDKARLHVTQITTIAFEIRITRRPVPTETIKATTGSNRAHNGYTRCLQHT